MDNDIYTNRGGEEFKIILRSTRSRTMEGKLCKEVPSPPELNLNGTNLWVSEDGDMWKGAKRVPAQIDKKGYSHNGHFIIDPDGKGLTKLRHRLVCMAWLGIPENYRKLDANHINMVPGDDRLMNLEWGTRRHNTQSSADLGGNGNVSIYYKKTLSSPIIKFVSIREMGRQLGGNKMTAVSKMRPGVDVLIDSQTGLFSRDYDALDAKKGFADIEKYRYGWFTVVDHKNNITYPPVRAIKDIVDCEKIFGVGWGGIKSKIAEFGSMIDGDTTIFFFLCGVHYGIQPPKDGEILDLEFRTLETSVFVFNILTGGSRRYSNMKSVCDATGVVRSSVQKSVDTNGSYIVGDKYRFSYTNDFPEDISPEEILRVGKFEITNPDTEVTFLSTKRKEYAAYINKYTPLSGEYIYRDIARHVRYVRESGWKLRILIGGIDYSHRIDS